jgi:hypothetical protein
MTIISPRPHSSTGIFQVQPPYPSLTLRQSKLIRRTQARINSEIKRSSTPHQHPSTSTVCILRQPRIYCRFPFLNAALYAMLPATSRHFHQHIRCQLQYTRTQASVPQAQNRNRESLHTSLVKQHPSSRMRSCNSRAMTLTSTKPEWIERTPRTGLLGFRRKSIRRGDVLCLIRQR